MRFEVAVIPVALVPAAGDQLRLMAFAPGGDFLRASLVQGQAAEGCAQALVRESADLLMVEGDVALEEVAFMSADAGLTLLYTVVLPLVDGSSRAAPPGTDEFADWVMLTPWVGRGKPRKPENLPQEQLLVRNYWRRQLEETSAVLEFLPRYFTTNQVRSAYSSLWGEEQHVGAFHRWLHVRDEPKTVLVTLVSEDEVRGAAEDAFTRALKESDLGPQMQTPGDAIKSAGVLGALAGSGVGLSAAVVGAGALGFLPAALIAGAVVGSRVAFQQKAGRGKKPLWFTRALTHRILIDDPYAPRPRWLPTGDRPGPFH